MGPRCAVAGGARAELLPGRRVLVLMQGEKGPGDRPLVSPGGKMRRAAFAGLTRAVRLVERSMVVAEGVRRLGCDRWKESSAPSHGTQCPASKEALD